MHTTAVILPFHGKKPSIASSALILPGAVVVGDVVIGNFSSVWFNAVVRGDDNAIRIGHESNIQDGCIVHVNSDIPTIIGNKVTIGHNVHLHACHLHDESLIGSGAIVLDGAVVESHAQVAAGALVAPGKTVRTGELWGGIPARKLRDLTPEEIEWIPGNADWYVNDLDEYRKTLEERS